ncbi:glycoside hydrolase family 13 protein (plasmid) [Enterococcus sp. 22-H-5-01]|uniref:glycoside hydrolase family 13 protein n=1 Tax=Enterococcus sp. 22-H-5-01 TaxID=3418555 RepID=UPI003D0521EA
MNTAAIYHRPDSEYAYLYTENLIHLRLRTARADCFSVSLVYGDPYQLNEKDWYKTTTPIKKILTTDLYDYWEIAITVPYRRLSYAFIITGYDNTSVFFTEHGTLPVNDFNLSMENNYFRMPYLHEIDRFKAPEWVKKTVWYQIFPERFSNGDSTNDPKDVLPWNSKNHPGRQDFYGGDLQGILNNLDYLVDLGINGIYLCPIFSAKSNHKYDTTDYFTIDPTFGDKKILKNLIDECHKRGIKIMLDAVFNHLGDCSEQWLDVIQNGEKSQFKDWFHIHSFPVQYEITNDFEHSENKNYDTFAFTPHMPKLNTANTEVQNYILSIAKYWIQEFDIDAWRLDVANEVDHHLWRQFAEVCHGLKKDFYILGEVWHSSQSWLQGDEFTAVMNYPFTDSIKAYFIDKTITLDRFVSNLNSQLMLYRKQTNQVMLNTIDSHDTPRLLTLTKGNKQLMKQIFAFLYLQQGVPCLYYGDEIGIDGGMDPDCRKCMIWDPKKQDLEMLEFTKQLIKLRHENQMIISDGVLNWAEIDSLSGTLVFERSLVEDKLIGIFNTGHDHIFSPLSGELLLSNLSSIKDNNLIIGPEGFAIIRV